MRSRWLPVGLILAVWAWSAWRLAVVWPRLPERMASHFNGAGMADGWSSKGRFVLFLLAITGGSTLLVLSIVSWMPWSLMNIPNKDHWQAPERQAVARGRMALWCAWFCLGMNLLLAGVLELTVRANLMPTPHLSSNVVAMLVGFLAFTGFMLALLHRQFRVPERGARR